MLKRSRRHIYDFLDIKLHYIYRLYKKLQRKSSPARPTVEGQSSRLRDYVTSLTKADRIRLW